MEIPVINRLSDTEAGLSSLLNPSVFSQFFEFSGIEQNNIVYSLWKLGAVVLILIASFTTVINRIRILIVRFRLSKVDRSLVSSPNLDEDYDSDTDTSCSSSDSEEEEEEETEEDEPSLWSYQKWKTFDEQFQPPDSGSYREDQAQSSDHVLRRRRGSLVDHFSFSEIAAGGKSVVKLWDNFQLGFRFELGESFMEGENSPSLLAGEFGTVPNISGTFPAAFVAPGGKQESGIVDFCAWDARVSGHFPAIIEEWRPKVGKIVDFGVDTQGVGEVYVGDDIGGGLTTSGVRKIRLPMKGLTDESVRCRSRR